MSSSTALANSTFACPAIRPAHVLPFFCRPTCSFELRLDVALRFVRRLRGQRVKLLPSALRLTPQQKRRLVQLLHAFDVHELGRRPTRRRRNNPPLRTRTISISRVEGFTRPTHRQPSHPQLDCAGRARLSQTSARRLTRSPIPPEHTLVLRPPALARRALRSRAQWRDRGGTHPLENLRPPPTPELSATVTPTCRDLAAALRGKTEASHARQVRAARHALRPHP